MSSHLPAFQFYPGDWRKDPAIQMLDYFDRGVWWELLCFMHEASPRGCLVVGGRWLDDRKIARLLGLGIDEWRACRARLEEADIPGVDPETNGVFSKRMVRDEIARLVKVKAGMAGGRPKTGGVTKAETESRSKAEAKQKQLSQLETLQRLVEFSTTETKSTTKADPKSTSKARRGSSVSVSLKRKKKKEKETSNFEEKEKNTDLAREEQKAKLRRLTDQATDDLPDVEGRG